MIERLAGGTWEGNGVFENPILQPWGHGQAEQVCVSAQPGQAAALVQAQLRRMSELSADTAAPSERARPPARASPAPTARFLDPAKGLWPQLAASG